MDRVRLLLADDHKLFRQGLAGLLRDADGEIDMVGEAGDGAEAVETCGALLPDVVLMDLKMPGVDGIAATQEIKRSCPSVQVLVLTASEDDADLIEALKAGATGYILKTADIDDLIQAVKLAAVNQATISPFMATKLLKEFRSRKVPPANDPRTVPLTPREKEVLLLLTKGASNREIASSLCVSEGTVKTHVHSILEKLALRNRTEAATFAMKSTV